MKVHIVHNPPLRLEAAQLAVELLQVGIQVTSTWFLDAGEVVDLDMEPLDLRVGAISKSLNSIKQADVVVSLGATGASLESVFGAEIGFASARKKPIFAFDSFHYNIYQALGAVTFNSRSALVQKLKDKHRAMERSEPEQSCLEEVRDEREHLALRGLS